MAVNGISSVLAIWRHKNKAAAWHAYTLRLRKNGNERRQMSEGVFMDHHQLMDCGLSKQCAIRVSSRNMPALVTIEQLFCLFSVSCKPSKSISATAPTLSTLARACWADLS